MRFTAGCHSHRQLKQGPRVSYSRMCFINSWVTVWCGRDFESSLTGWPPTLQEVGKGQKKSHWSCRHRVMGMDLESLTWYGCTHAPLGLLTQTLILWAVILDSSPRIIFLATQTFSFSSDVSFDSSVTASNIIALFSLPTLQTAVYGEMVFHLLFIH